ncbi:MAG: hypothetical protein NC078_07035 [Ruminococcus sp.]|nr:hypothetical protein [Ruminococcus sp.]
MNQSELITVSIDKYVDLQRIVTADNPKEEAEYQLKVIKAKLESMGIVTTDLNISKVNNSN